METLAILLALGVIGGSVFALLAALLHVRLPGPAGAEQFVRRQLSTDVINMANIKVAGIGGLGLVALCAIIALTIPSIGISVATGLVTGSLLALVWIYRRRQAGPLPSSGQGSGANTVLAIDEGTRSAHAPDAPARDGRPISFVPV